MAFAPAASPMLAQEAWLASTKAGLFWPSFAASAVVAASVAWDAGTAEGREASAASALCEAPARAAEVAAKYDGFDRCPRVKTFGEVFNVKSLGIMTVKNTSLSILTDMAPYVHELITEYQDAELEEREPNIAPMPSLWPAMKRGLYLALRQATVTFVRWMFDWGVSVYCSAETALRLLTDYRWAIEQVLVEEHMLKRIVPLYWTTLNAYQTWAAADFTVSVAVLTYKTTMMKGISWKDKSRFWSYHAFHQGCKCFALSVVDPVGAVVGGVVFKSYAAVIMGYAATDLVAFNYFEQAK